MLLKWFWTISSLGAPAVSTVYFILGILGTDLWSQGMIRRAFQSNNFCNQAYTKSNTGEGIGLNSKARRGDAVVRGPISLHWKRPTHRLDNWLKIYCVFDAGYAGREVDLEQVCTRSW